MSDLTNTSARPLTRDQAESLVDAVMEHDDLAVTASAFEDASTGEWVFEATCGSEPDLAAFADLARQTLGGDISFSVEPIDPEVNWVARSLEGLQPVVAGGFYVHGSHDTAPAPSGSIGIRIDAAQAFGTGHHGTTAGCLEAIDWLARRYWFDNPIDIGTGTGVLAIAIAKRLRIPVLATDIDPVAVKTTAENARDNGADALVTAIQADGLASPRILTGAPYGLVVANILAAPLIRIAPGVGRVAAPGAIIVLSGLLATQALRVQTAYHRHGMTFVRKLVRGEWATLVLEKK